MDRVAMKGLLRDVFTQGGEGIQKAASAIFTQREDSASVPSILYHYTTAQGLLGIIETECLWLTHSSFMNDPGEHQYAIDLFKASVLQHEGKLPKSLRADLQHLVYPLDGLRSSLPAFVASFTEDGDLLSQWRGYGALGAGYALGFNGPTLAALAADRSALRGGIFQVKYVESFDDDIPVQFLECVGELCTELGIKNPGRFLNAFFLDLFAYLARCKHPAFIEEIEWRLISWGENKLCFRTVENALRPYIQFSLRKSSSGSFPLQRIVCGPSVAPISALQAVKLLLETHGHRHVEVTSSSVPFRP